jgi:hypothetical protein
MDKRPDSAIMSESCAVGRAGNFLHDISLGAGEGEKLTVLMQCANCEIGSVCVINLAGFDIASRKYTFRAGILQPVCFCLFYCSFRFTDIICLMFNP